MFCPVCKGEFREGFTKCDICKVGLVEDLENLPEYIEGEFKICPNCHEEYEEVDVCPDCNLKVIRVLPGREDEGPEYIYLEKPDFEPVNQDSSVELELAFDVSAFKHCVDLSGFQTDVLLETEDMELMHKLMKSLDEAGYDFAYVPPSDQPSTSLGSIFGMSSPLARSFPQVVVKLSDLDAATHLIANNPELALFEVPEELMDYEDDEDDEE